MCKRVRIIKEGRILKVEGIEGLRLLYFGGISALLFLLTFVIYRKKDILV